MKTTAPGIVSTIAAFMLLLLIFALGCEDDSIEVSDQRFSERSDSSFAVGDSTVLEVENFAGSVVLVPGSPGVVVVAVEKWAERKEDLDRIEVEMSQSQSSVRVATEDPLKVNRASVDLEITVPPDTRPILQNGAGTISYLGRAEGETRFTTGAGTITLKLPAQVNVEVHLVVGAGTIRVDFPVVGQVSDNLVDGIIGTGADGRIEAQVGAGKIIVTRQ